MVKSVIGGVITLHVSGAYQIRAGVVTKYYPGGAFRVGGTLYYALTDHLGSTSLTTTAGGAKYAEMRYKAWGEVRHQWQTTPTDKTYTGQRSYANDFGLMYYNARWYDSYLSRFAQADSVLSDPVYGWDRYAYVNNNPLNYSDPSGNTPQCKVQCTPADVLDIKKLSGSGRNLYLTYTQMWKKADGWWWNTYGEDGAFTLDEFMAINWHYEQAGRPLEAWSKAVQNAAALWSASNKECQAGVYTCDLSTGEGSLNFLGYYSQVARDRAKSCAAPTGCDLNTAFNGTEWGKKDAEALVTAIHGATPRTDFEDWEWMSFGNVSLNPTVYGKMIKRGWTGPVIAGGDSMFVLSYCQATFAWWAIRMGKQNHASPLVYLTGRNYNSAAFCGR